MWYLSSKVLNCVNLFDAFTFEICEEINSIESKDPWIQTARLRVLTKIQTSNLSHWILSSKPEMK